MKAIEIGLLLQTLKTNSELVEHFEELQQRPHRPVHVPIARKWTTFQLWALKQTN